MACETYALSQGGPLKLHVLLAVTTLASACNPCHSWDEVKIVDRADHDDSETITIIEGVLDTFANWTGRGTTCVGKVKVVEKQKVRGEVVGGTYNANTRNIVVGYCKSDWAMESITFHELCHAVDDEEGFPSLDHAEALEPYTEDLDEALYATDDARTMEAFADICELGPLLHPLWRQMEEHCGDDYLDPAYQAVHELMFTALDRTLDLGSFEGTAQEWGLAGIEPAEGAIGSLLSGPLVAGANGLFMLDTLFTLDDESSSESYQPVLRRIDPHSATVLESLALDSFTEHLIDSTGDFTLQRYAMLGSTTEPLLYDRFDPGVAWYIHSAPLELEAIDLPTLIEGASIEGFERDGQLIASIDEGDGLYQATATLGDAAWAQLDFEGLALEGADVQAFDASEDGALLVFYGATGPELVSVSVQGELEWIAPMGLEGGPSYTFTVNHLPDGSVLTASYVMVGRNAVKKFPLRYNPEDESFSAANGGCHTMRYYLDGVTWDGGYWMVYHPWEDEPYSPLTLMQLEIEIEP